VNFADVVKMDTETVSDLYPVVSARIRGCCSLNVKTDGTYNDHCTFNMLSMRTQYSGLMEARCSVVG
jgi:hypothetical protein